MVRFVHDHADDLETAIQLEAVNDPEGGIVVFEVTPGRRARVDSSSLLHDLAAALGKRVSGPRRLDDTDLPAELVAWLQAAATREVVAVRAHLAHGGNWRYLAKLTEAADADLTLVIHGGQISRSQREFIRDTAVTTTALEDLISRLGSEQRPARPATPRRFPLVPRDGHWLTFRKTCQQLLDHDEFEQVRVRFDHSLQQAASWFEGEPTITEPQLLNELRRSFPATASYDEVLTILCGTACGLWQHDWHLYCQFDSLAATLEQTGTAPLDEHHCEQIATLVRTDAAAAAVLALLLPNVPFDDLANLNLDQVAPDGATVTLTGRTYGVPEYARPPIRAQLHYRRNQGGADEDPFIPRRNRERTDSPVRRHTPHTWSRLLSTTGSSLGVALKRNPHTPTSISDWGRRAGIRITPLSSQVRALRALVKETAS